MKTRISATGIGRVSVLVFNSHALDQVVFSRVHATLHSTLSVRWSVGRLVGRSVGRLVGPFLLFIRFIPTTVFALISAPGAFEI